MTDCLVPARLGWWDLDNFPVAARPSCGVFVAFFQNWVDVLRLHLSIELFLVFVLYYLLFALPWTKGRRPGIVVSVSFVSFFFPSYSESESKAWMINSPCPFSVEKCWHPTQLLSVVQKFKYRCF
jgi:hypothetical protein